MYKSICLILFAACLSLNLSAQNWTASDIFFGYDAYHYLGNDIASDGNVVVVSGTSEAMAVYVYELIADSWVQTATLTPPDSNDPNEALFGGNVAIHGDIILVNSSLFNMFTGKVYLYEKPQGGWSDMTPTSTLATTFPLPTGANFGSGLSVQDEVVVVGAPSSEGDPSETGRALVYTKPANGWTTEVFESAILVPSNPAPYDWFGVDVSIDSDAIAVGSARTNESGSAYIFEKPAGGWENIIMESAIISNTTDGFVDDNFGRKLTLKGDMLISPIFRDNPATSGVIDQAIYIMKKGTDWASYSQLAKLEPTDLGNEDKGFGWEVAVDGNRIIAGQFDGDKVYIFDKSGADWSDMSESSTIEFDDPNVFNRFGASVAGVAPYIIVGNPQTEMITNGELTFYLDSEATAVESAILEGIDVFPNPVQGLLNIELGESQASRLELTNALGQVVGQQEIVSSNLQLDLSKLQTGVYFLNFSFPSGETGVKKILVEN